MATLTSIQFLFLFGSLIASDSVESCPFKECRCRHDFITCGEQGLTAIPPLTGNISGYKSLSMETNRITKIPVGSLPPALVTIDLQSNPIATIDVDAFNDSQNTLEYLSLSGATFTRIPDAFLHLRVLTSLTIEDTPIQDWNDLTMKNIALNLNYLQLINVTLHTWPNWMKYFSQLRYVSFQSNFITDIPDSALDMLANTLTNLDLRQNNLTTIPKAIQNLTSLQYLSLDYNKISYISWVPLTNNLLAISLIGNQLVDAHSLSNFLRPSANSLTEISLYDNNLSEIPDLSFLTKVNNLDITNNRISNHLAGSLSSIIDSFYLDNNFLPAIPRVYTNLTSVYTIQMASNLVREIRGVDIPVWVINIGLTYNIVTELTDASFPENSSITTLSLNSNPIVKISLNAFTNLQRLTSLNLQNTKLTRLPLALDSLTSLTWLDMSGSRELVCTCQEKNLRAWFMKHQSSIGGSCGVATIPFFFEFLSPSCP